MVETAQEYSRRIVASVPSDRVRAAIQNVRDSMEEKRRGLSNTGSVLNDETRSLPLIVRKAMAEREKLRGIRPAVWEGQLFAGCYAYLREALANDQTLPEFAAPEERREGARYGYDMYSMFGHISPDYPRVLRKGTRRLREMAAAHLETAQEQEQKDFLSAALISLEGLEALAENHAAFLLAQAEGEADAARRAELLALADICARVPMEPARTYQEACQSVWFTHLALQLTGNHLALGRPDQYLWPYLEGDLREGRLDTERAQELTDLWLLKFNERAISNLTAAQIADWHATQEEYDRQWRERTIHDMGQQRYNVRDKIDATIHWNQNIIVGGCHADGSDAANLATAMILESFRRLRMTNPVMSVRIHEGTPEWLFRQAAVCLKTGGGLPCLYNDGPIVAGYERFGIPPEDARDYANNGCWECILPGRTDFYFNKLNGLKCLEWTLNRGRCHIDGKQEVPDQGDPSGFPDFATVFQLTMENIAYVADNMAAHMCWTNPHRSSIAPTPLLSATLDGPLEKGRDMTDMSTRFIIGGVIMEGISHLIDSLVAIELRVFKERRITMAQLTEAIDHNFAGYEDIRALLNSCPKYGMGDEAADAMGHRVVDCFYSIMQEINKRYDAMTFMPGIGTFSWYIAVGEGTGATADGRGAAEPVASNFSPSAGALQKGITAAIRSFTSMGLDGVPLGSPLDIGMSERYVKGEEGTRRLMGLVKTFRDLGGNLMTISVADSETLRDAQRNPAAYRDLRVRMGGWSAYFTMLSKEQQEHHIRKAEGGIF